MMNYAAMMESIQNITVREVEMPCAGEGEALVKLAYNGVCGSDMHYYEYGVNGNNACSFPFLLGHECSATVVKTGKNVTNIVAGDRVAVEPGIACGRCEFCKSGRYNLCLDMKFLAAPPYFGSLQTYMTFPAHGLYKLPEQVSLLEGCLIEPLSVGMHAVRQAKIGVGDHVLIYGAGCVGLVTLLAAKAAGASKIFVADVLENRLKKARELGADKTVLVTREDINRAVTEKADESGVHKIIDTTGATAVIMKLPEIVRRGGIIVLLGSSIEEYVPINVMELINKEITVKTVFRYRNIFPLAIEAIANGKIDIKKIITNIYDFHNTQQAFVDAANNKENTIKVAIKMDD